MLDEFDPKDNYSPITPIGTEPTTESTQYREHSIVADATSEFFVSQTTGRGCVRCERHISSGTLTEEELGAVRRDVRADQWPDREAADWRGAVKQQKLVSDQVTSRREAALSRKVCPNCHYVHQSELLLDQARVPDHWRRVSPTYFRAFVSDIKEKIKRMINRLKVSKTH